MPLFGNGKGEDFAGPRIEAIRKNLGDTQAAFAKRIGRPGSQGEVSKWVRGAEEPPMKALEDIAALVGGDISMFQENGPDPFAAGIQFALRGICSALLREENSLVPFLGAEMPIHEALMRDREGLVELEVVDKGKKTRKRVG